MAFQHVVELLPLVAVGGLARGHAVILYGDDKGLGLLVLEIVGQVLVLVGLAALKSQALPLRVRM